MWENHIRHLLQARCSVFIDHFFHVFMNVFMSMQKSGLLGNDYCFKVQTHARWND